MFYQRIEQGLREKLNRRRAKQTFRQLAKANSGIDFCSNDYLGFVADGLLQLSKPSAPSGSRASRLIAGNSEVHEQLEKRISEYHGATSGLLFNSGYDANVGLLGCIAQAGERIVYDELCHASIRDGLKMSLAASESFPHNNLEALSDLLEQSSQKTFVVTEGLFSMDGDRAPLAAMIELCKKHQAAVIIDEAHSNGVLGVQGRGLVCELGLEKKVFARVHTFGKALGCHGAIVLGSENLRDYLINYARSFIFTTAMSPHNLLFIDAAYDLLAKSDRIQILQEKIKTFRSHLSPDVTQKIVADSSPIQSIVIGGAEATRAMAHEIQEKGFDVKPIVSPTVKAGFERIRICIHASHQDKDLIDLAILLNQLSAPSNLSKEEGFNTPN